MPTEPCSARSIALACRRTSTRFAIRISKASKNRNRRFFEIVLERCGGRPETTLHVGDLYHVDIVGARNTGLTAMLLDRHDQYAEFDVERMRTLGELVGQSSSKGKGQRRGLLCPLPFSNRRSS